MIIFIEGKSGKSRVLENLINNEIEGKIVVLDSVGVKGLKLREGGNHLIIKSLSLSMLNHIDIEEEFSEFDWIALEMNVSDSDKTIQTLKKLDEETHHNWIVTMDNQKMEDVKVYQLE